MASGLLLNHQNCYTKTISEFDSHLKHIICLLIPGNPACYQPNKKKFPKDKPIEEEKYDNIRKLLLSDRIGRDKDDKTNRFFIL